MSSTPPYPKLEEDPNEGDVVSDLSIFDAKGLKEHNWEDLLKSQVGSLRLLDFPRSPSVQRRRGR